MNSLDFLRIINESLTPFLREMGFSMGEPVLNGKYYNAQFTGKSHSLSITFEPGADQLFVFVLNRTYMQLSDIDDRSKTPRLSDLNGLYMKTVSKEERIANEDLLKGIVVQDENEMALLKAAKEIRLVLPKYLAEQDSISP